MPWKLNQFHSESLLPNFKILQNKNQSTCKYEKYYKIREKKSKKFYSNNYQWIQTWFTPM